MRRPAPQKQARAAPASASAFFLHTAAGRKSIPHKQGPAHCGPGARHPPPPALSSASAPAAPAGTKRGPERPSTTAPVQPRSSCRTQAVPGPEQQRQHAEQRHGAEFLPADGVCLQDSTGKLRQQPKRQRGHPRQPERLRPLPECARKQDQRRQNGRVQQPGQQCRAHRTGRGRGVCQCCGEHAEAQCRARKPLSVSCCTSPPVLPDIEALPGQAAVVAPDDAVLCKGCLRNGCGAQGTAPSCRCRKD